MLVIRGASLDTIPCQQDRLERAVTDEETAASHDADRWLKGFGQEDYAQVQLVTLKLAVLWWLDWLTSCAVCYE